MRKDYQFIVEQKNISSFGYIDYKKLFKKEINLIQNFSGLRFIEPTDIEEELDTEI